MVDARAIDAEPLIASPNLEDNLIAILARLGEGPTSVRRILNRIAREDGPARDKAMAELMILAGLRTWKMGREIRRGIEIGRHEGLMAERRILASILSQRFGELPSWAADRIEMLSAESLEKVAGQCIHAPNLEILLND